jgi:hypothetical protein
VDVVEEFSVKSHLLSVEDAISSGQVEKKGEQGCECGAAAD